MGGKKVLIFGSYAPSLVNFRGALINAIIERGHKVVAAAPEMSNGVGCLLGRLGAVPRELPLINASLNPLSMLGSFRSVRRMVREVRPDVMISYTAKPVILGAIAGKLETVPTIVSLITGVGYAFTEGRETKRRLSRRLATPLYRRALANSTKVIFQNADDLGLFRQLKLVDPIHGTYIVNGSGVDLDHFAVVPLPPRPSFLMIARLLKDKGVREFAQAAKRLKAEHPDVPVTLVGYLDPSPDSLTRSELDDLVAHGIDYQGSMKDVRPAIADCSTFVLPSYREGTPRSVLEAMAMGRAIITTDAPGCKETVEQGRSGFLVPPRDADALYEAMMRFVADHGLADRMGSKSRAIAEAKYDVNKVNADIIRFCGL